MDIPIDILLQKTRPSRSHFFSAAELVFTRMAGYAKHFMTASLPAAALLVIGETTYWTTYFSAMKERLDSR